MAGMNVSLPDPMKDWVEAQTVAGRYANSSDYVRDLIRRDQERLAKIAELQSLIDQGLASGISMRPMSNVLAEARQKAKLAANPFIARLRPEYDPPVRLHRYRAHMIVFTEDEFGVLIVRVLHGRQDWDSALA